MSSRFESMGSDQISYPVNQYNTTLQREVDFATTPKSHQLMRWIGATALFCGLHGVGVLSEDVHRGIQAGKERVESDFASVHTVYEYNGDDEVYSQHATVVLTGLGTKDASETAASLVAHRDIGSVYAVEYSNKDLNTQAIAQQIATKANRDGITHLSFDGYSMGGPIALDIATQLQENEDNPKVASVAMNSSPIGDGSLTERSAQSVRAMERVLSLHRDLVYYENGRIVIELIARNEHYLKEIARDAEVGLRLHSLQEYSFNGRRYRVDYDSLRHELSEVKHKMSQPKIADANLIKNQANVLNSDIRSKIQHLDEQTLVIYTRSKSEKHDPVVDVSVSERNVVEILTEYEQPHKVLREHIQHANPVERQQEYDHMIRRDIQPDIIYYLQAQAADYATEEALETLPKPAK